MVISQLRLAEKREFLDIMGCIHIMPCFSAEDAKTEVKYSKMAEQDLNDLRKPKQYPVTDHMLSFIMGGVADTSVCILGTLTAQVDSMAYKLAAAAIVLGGISYEIYHARVPDENKLVSTGKLKTTSAVAGIVTAFMFSADIKQGVEDMTSRSQIEAPEPR